MSDDAAAAVAELPPLSAEITKAVTDAFETLRERALVADIKPVNDAQPKSWFSDPFAMLDSVGMGYRNAPTYLTYDTLRQVAERDTFCSAILLTRIDQVCAFARPQPNKYSVGFKIQPRHGDKKRLLTEGERQRCDELTTLVLDTGREYNLGRDSFRTFLSKLIRDSLTYDQACVETVRTRGGSVYSFNAVPSDTIRTATPKQMKGTPPNKQQVKSDLAYVQVINGTITAEFTRDEMGFGVRNPRTHVKTYGYGFPEIEMLMTTITSHLWAEEWNRKAFSQGSTLKGILNVKGNIPPVQMEAFKRMWHTQVAGVQNSHKTPILNSEEIQWMPLQLSNTEMGYQMWVEYLCKITCAIFRIDPSEINFDLRGGVGQQPVFMGQNDAQQKMSKDRGLQPLMHFVEDFLNRNVVWKVDPRFELAFVGLDAKTEEQAIQLRMQQVQNTHKLNEVRAMDDLLPVPDGDVVLNPTYIGYLMQKQQMEMMSQQAAQQQQPGAQQGGQPGQAGQPAPPPPRFSQPPGEDEAHGADQIRQFNEQKPGQVSGKPDDEGQGPDAQTLSTLHRDDWSSTFEHSLKSADLMKSELFEDIDL